MKGGSGCRTYPAVGEWSVLSAGAAGGGGTSTLQAVKASTGCWVQVGRRSGSRQEVPLKGGAAGRVRMGQGEARGENGAGRGGWPYNNALHPATGRGALLLRAKRCSAPAAGERARWASKSMRGLVMILLVFSASYAIAASFDCSKAKNFAEKSVCADSDLSRLDDALSRIYRIALERVKDKEQLRAEQRQWLAKRDACDYSNVSDNYERNSKQKYCVQYLYIARLKEINTVVYSQKGMGLYRCSPRASKGGNFVITNGIITEFNATTSVSGTEFARGYTLTCVQHIDNFYQTSSGKEYVLQFFPTNDQYGESADCQVHIEDLSSKFRVRTSKCQSECMVFDYEVKKSECYHTQ